MSNPDSAFFVFDNHAAAEEAIRTVGHSGFDMKKPPLVGHVSAAGQDRARTVLGQKRAA